jgi:ribonucleotide reductase alpha subunit
MGVAARFANENMALLTELTTAELWREDMANNGFRIHDYLAHQTSKQQVEEKRQSLRERQKRYREKHAQTEEPPIDDGWDNALITEPEYRTQNTEYIKQNTEIQLPSPRVKTAALAVSNISNKLAEARANGINAWNLSKLVEEEWDKLHNANDIGGCIALTAWYVAELQTRQLSSTEIGRIGQMTKRFGRIALLAIDEAASKDLTDLVSYAYRVAQNMYKERQGK